MAGRKVLLALRDADSVKSLVTLACQLANGMGADLVALHVVEVPMATPIEADDPVLDKPGQEILAKAARMAAEQFSRKISTQLLRARNAGEALIGEVKDQHMDMLVMGYHHPHTVGEILLGSVVQYVTRHAPCRVIVQIPPVHHR